MCPSPLSRLPSSFTTIQTPSVWRSFLPLFIFTRNKLVVSNLHPLLPRTRDHSRFALGRAPKRLVQAYSGISPFAAQERQRNTKERLYPTVKKIQILYLLLFQWLAILSLARLRTRARDNEWLDLHADTGSKDKIPRYIFQRVLKIRRTSKLPFAMQELHLIF